MTKRVADMTPEERETEERYRRARWGRRGAYSARYYQSNKRRINSRERTRRNKKPGSHYAAVKRWKKANPEKVRQQRRRWKERNPERAKAKRRRWYAANRDKAIAASTLWRKKNPEKARLITCHWRNKNIARARILESAASRARYARAPERFRAINRVKAAKKRKTRILAQLFQPL